MKAREIGDTLISFYKKQSDKTGEIIKLKEYLVDKAILYKPYIDFLRSIQNEEEQKNYKRNMLPCAMISGIGGSDKSRENMVKKNNLMFIDMDYDENPTFSSEQILNTHAYSIFRKPYVYAVGRSCRNKGLFCIILVEDIDKIEQYHLALKDIFAKEFTIVLDDNCQNPNRAKFISYDENLINGEWIKDDDEEIIPFNEINPDYKIIDNHYQREHKTIPVNSILNDDLFIIKCIIKLITECNYQANEYFAWLKDGFRLATLDYNTGYFLFLLISRKSQGYKNDKEVKNKFDECCKHTKYDKTSLSYYFGLLKQKYGNDWIKKVNEINLDKYISNK